MAFEIFKETGTRTKEFISVTERKSFGLSRAFLDKHEITAEHKAVIFYDPESKKVALHFSLNNPKFGFAVRIANPKHGATIVAKSFFEIKAIDAKLYAGRYSDIDVLSLTEIGQDQPGKAFVLALKERLDEADPWNAGGSTTEVVDDLFGDKPINLDDIPF